MLLDKRGDTELGDAGKINCACIEWIYDNKLRVRENQFGLERKQTDHDGAQNRNHDRRDREQEVSLRKDQQPRQ